jgi:uncharacterized SAM-binding protein YcdF (DUF218 family)
MHSILSWLAIESWKPWLTALLLPPVPLLLLMWVGARRLVPRVDRRRRWGWFVMLVGTAALWLTACTGFARALEPLLLRAVPAITAERIGAMRAEAQTNHANAAQGRSSNRKDAVAIVVLGSGVEAYAPEYGTSNLTASSLERLRYGVWLGRETDWPVAFSGGLGWGNRAASDRAAQTSEAEVAARVAKHEFGRPLRWTETESRDTRENAVHSLALLHADGVRHVVIVTHGWQMSRARARFDAEAAARYPDLRIDTAPIGLATDAESGVLAWLPSSGGFQRVRLVLREWLGAVLQA